MAFKMKRWSGYQKPSPINKIDLSGTLSKVQSTISNLFEGIKIKPNTGEGFIRQTIGTGPGQITESEYIEKYGKLPGLGLTLDEKKMAKKFGMSDWQWKTGTNLSHDQHFKRKKWMENNPTTTITTTSNDDPTKDVAYNEELDYLYEDDPIDETISTSIDEGEWVQDKHKSDWWYRKTDKGYQTKKGEDGRVIDVFDEKSQVYQSISEKVFDIYKNK